MHKRNWQQFRFFLPAKTDLHEFAGEKFIFGIYGKKMKCKLHSDSLHFVQNDVKKGIGRIFLFKVSKLRF